MVSVDERIVIVREKFLKKFCHHLQIVQRDDQFVTLVDDYRSRLRHLITNISDFLSRQNFPPTWPESLKEFRLCVETEAAPLMLSPSGQFIVPASCPGLFLMDFTTFLLPTTGGAMRKVAKVLLALDLSEPNYT